MGFDEISCNNIIQYGLEFGIKNSSVVLTL